MPTTSEELVVPGHEVSPLEVELASLSPVSFMRVRVGDLLRIKVKAANRREYRDKIGAAADCLLVFKGETKIGMVPHNVAVNGAKACRVTVVDSHAGVLRVLVLEAPPAREAEA